MLCHDCVNVFYTLKPSLDNVSLSESLLSPIGVAPSDRRRLTDTGAVSLEPVFDGGELSSGVVRGVPVLPLSLPESK